jgi:hypothetical protein
VLLLIYPVAHDNLKMLDLMSTFTAQTLKNIFYTCDVGVKPANLKHFAIEVPVAKSHKQIQNQFTTQESRTLNMLLLAWYGKASSHMTQDAQECRICAQSDRVCGSILYS